MIKSRRRAKGDMSFLPGCVKKGYSKKIHAETVLEREHSKSDMIVYKCPRCSKFHIGHDKYTS